MRIYTIFDDFTEDASKTLRKAGIELTIHPKGVPRPDPVMMKSILETYDGVIIGTTQAITPGMFERIDTPRIIASASVGLDHISLPDNKKDLITVFNTPKANAKSVAEYTVGCALACVKRLNEGRMLYLQGRDNKKLHRKPEDLAGKKLGVFGAGNISSGIMEYGRLLGMEVSCWTVHPSAHTDLKERGIKFESFDSLLESADVISVNLPNNAGTKNLISGDEIRKMKDTAVFISVSRAETVDYTALFQKAKERSEFYVCLDLDVKDEIVSMIPDIPNVIVTPHIAGGTVETRKRMFRELSEQIAGYSLEAGRQ